MSSIATRPVSQHHTWSGHNSNQPGVCCDLGNKPGSCAQKKQVGELQEDADEEMSVHPQGL